MKHVLSSGGRGALALALGAILALSLAGPAAAADPTRPFLGHSSGASVVGNPAGHCPNTALFYVTDAGSGTFTHLGRVHYTLEHCATLLPSGIGTTVGSGLMTAVAANGDRLLLSYDATFEITMLPAPTAVADLHWAATGGTGRFAAATGKGTAALKVAYNDTLTGGTTSLVWWGTITY